MSQAVKETWLPKLQARYTRRNREGKSRMPDEFCEDHDYERKYAIKLLRGALPLAGGRARLGPEPRYGLIEPIVRQLWLAAEQPCGKRLVPILEQWLPYYERRFGRLSSRQRQLLRAISAATLDRLLAQARAQLPGAGRRGTKPGSLLKTDIPIRTGTWDLTRPGYYREQVENPTVRDVYPSFEACAEATGIPVALLKQAKRQGCPALSGNRVEMGPFLRWWYAKGKEQVADYERERAEQMVLQNTKLRMALRRLKRELVPAEEAHRLDAELGGAIRKVLTRLHRAAPSLDGRTLEVIEARLEEQEQEILAQLQILEDQLADWQRAE